MSRGKPKRYQAYSYDAEPDGRPDRQYKVGRFYLRSEAEQACRREVTERGRSYAHALRTVGRQVGPVYYYDQEEAEHEGAIVAPPH